MTQNSDATRIAPADNDKACPEHKERTLFRASIAVLVVGTLFLLCDAFHGNIWFDESYSVAIATHSFTEIWSIGSYDVHPVLFYWALHVLYLIFGQNILVYRLFTVLGSVALAALGPSLIRHDFGARVGLFFTFLALFTPYIAQISVEIRMYSWVSFTVLACALYGYRIVASLCKTVPGRIAQGTQGLKTWAGAPRRWWVLFALTSLASSYLQYYGTMSAFMINLVVFIFLLAHLRKHRRALGVFFILAVIQIALYLPWLFVAVFSQLGTVSNTYWAKLAFPTTIIELLTYPMLTSQLSFAFKGEYGSVEQGLLIALMIITAIALIAVAVRYIRCWVRRSKSQALEQDDASNSDSSSIAAPDGEAAATGKKPRGMLGELTAWMRKDTVAPFLGALAVYALVALFAALASVVMNSLILYYRYLFVAIGPLLLFTAAAFAYIKPRAFAYIGCCIVLCTSILNMVCLTRDDYDPQNQEVLDAFEEAASVSDLVISSDIGFMGVTSVTYPSIPQTYMDWQKGNWGKAYEAYDVSMESEKSWELILNDFHGIFVVTGQSQKENVLPRDITDLDDKDGITLISRTTYYRPYERTWFTIAVMEKD